MCGRYRRTTKEEELARIYKITIPPHCPKLTHFPFPTVKHNLLNAGPDVHGSNRPDVVGTQDRASATSLHGVVFCLDTGIPASGLC